MGDMKKHSFTVALILCMALSFATGCEDDDDDSDETSVPTNAPATSVSDPETELLGVWVGTAGSTQVKTTLELRSYEFASRPESFDNGTVTWANGDRRTVIGAEYDGTKLILQLIEYGCDPYSPDGCPQSEIWVLYYDGASLSGEGTKYNEHGREDGVYDINLARPQ